MSDKNTGGPAFPFPSDCASGEPGELGMTLRDYFAAKAMQSLILANPKDFHDEAWARNERSQLSVTRTAYKYADDMLKARDQ